MAYRTAAVALACVLAALAPASAQAARVLVMDRTGAVHAREDRFVAPAPADERAAAARTPRATAAAARRPATPPALRRLLAAGAIDQPTYDRAIGDYRRATALVRRLRGARRAALAGVVSDLDGMAARGQVVPTRLPALLATLEANLRWWTTGPLLGAGARVSFAGSQLVWQHYPGHGIQIQWLATFGKANALWRDGGRDGQFAELLAEAASLASRRAGGIAFEYLFGFDGGAPPWVSGLAQGTALSAYSRGTQRLGDPTWLELARSALGIFRTPPPQGVAQARGAGTHYLQYSFAPRLHILNGFIQALNGLLDYAQASGDPEAQALFAAGDAEARAELPRYDTGGWSMYSEHSESSLDYQRLVRDFLLGLCKRLQKTGGSGQPYCRYGYRFATDLTTPPVLELAPSGRLRARRPARVRFRIDKPATVSLLVRRGAFAYRTTARVDSGVNALRWRPPRAGDYELELAATDLAGNRSAVSSSAAVRRH